MDGIYFRCKDQHPLAEIASILVGNLKQNQLHAKWATIHQNDLRRLEIELNKVMAGIKQKYIVAPAPSSEISNATSNDLKVIRKRVETIKDNNYIDLSEVEVQIKYFKNQNISDNFKHSLTELEQCFQEFDYELKEQSCDGLLKAIKEGHPMSNKSSTVLVVDDSATDLQITMSAIGSDFKVLAAKSGEQALKMMDQIKADVILFDVSMPEMGGYETCRRMINKNNEVDIIFVSSNDSTEEIMKGFELGGSDYVVKPLCPEILLNKVKRLIKDKAQKLALKQEMEIASKVAMTAMSSSGELSIIFEFLRNSFKSKSVKELAILINNSLASFEFQASFVIRISDKKQYFSTSGDVPPIEKELLNRIAHMKERIVEKGKRLFLNNGQISLLIKNLPKEDDEKVGRLRDYLAILAEGASDKAETIMQQMQAAALRSESMTALIEEANDSLAYIHKMQKNIEKQNVTLLDDLVTGVEDAFVGLELSDEQEESILNLLNDAQDKSVSLFHKNAELETEMESIVAKFRQFIN